MSEEKILEVNNLHVHYDGLQALKGVSLHINRGELVSVVGTNGAGKTTLINAISGLVQPSEGSVIFEGQDITNEKPFKIVKLGISHVQEGRATFPELSVEDNLLIGSYLPRVRANREKNFDKVYKMFPRLHERKEQIACTMSGGEQQMLAIGRALMAEPKLIIFDEISLGLAPIIIEELYEVVRVIRSEGISILLVEQNTVRALNEADRAYFFEVGKVTLSGHAEDLKNNDQVKKICFI